MCKLNKKSGCRRIDPCIRPFIGWLKNKHITVASCCGHSKYPITIIVKEGVEKKIIYREILSQKIITRKRRFYKKDKQGYYYIPETL